MKSIFERFDWGRFFQFSIPYAFGMKIFGANWSWPGAMIAGMLFGTFMTLLMGKSLQESEKHQLPKPKVIWVQHDPSVKALYLLLFHLGVLMGFVLGTLSLFASQLDPQTPKDFPGALYAFFFYGMSLACYTATLGIQYSYKIGIDGISKIEKKFFGTKEDYISFEEIESINTSIWGTILIQNKNGQLFTMSVPIGKDFSLYEGMDIPLEDIKNPNFPGAYQIWRELERRVQQNKIDQLAA